MEREQEVAERERSGEQGHRSSVYCLYVSDHTMLWFMAKVLGRLCLNNVIKIPPSNHPKILTFEGYEVFKITI